MGKDHVSGIADKIAGSMKEAIGMVTGDTKLQAEGTAQKIGGKLGEAANDAGDAVRDTVKK